MPENLRLTMDFLRDLRQNNNKAWFEANRQRYEAARGALEDFVTDVIFNFGQIDDLGQLTAKDCMFRINRDVRFSADKSPYKTSMGALIGREGRKTTGRHYYINLDPEGDTFLGGGAYMPTSAQLHRIRQRLAEDSKPLKKIIENPDFVKYFGSIRGEKLKTAPQGFPKDHPDLDLLRFKQYLALHPLSEEQLYSPDFRDHVLTVFKAYKPFIVYIVEAMGE